MTAGNSLIISKGADISQYLAALDIALDHPIERSARQQFLDPLGHHARGVKLFRRQTGAPALIEPEIDPCCKIFDRSAADAKFNKIESHGRELTLSRAKVNQNPWVLHKGSANAVISSADLGKHLVTGCRDGASTRSLPLGNDRRVIRRNNGHFRSLRII